MKRRIITRRRAIVAGLASIGGFIVARSPGELPPTYGSLLRMGDNLTYAAQRALLPQQALATEGIPGAERTSRRLPLPSV